MNTAKKDSNRLLGFVKELVNNKGAKTKEFFTHCVGRIRVMSSTLIK